MNTQPPRQIRYHYARPGRSITVYDEWLALDRPDVKVLLLEKHAGKPFSVNGQTVMDPGAPIVWFIFPGARYDVGRFHRADGVFTGWYTNLTEPADIRDPTDWRCTDLFLDLWTPPSGASSWIDELEFDDAVRHGLLDAAQARSVGDERREIEGRLARNDWPPRIAREVDLARVRELLA